MATITITVTVAGGKFVLDGVSQATYSATPGNTYKFDQSDGTNGTHPLRLSTTSDGTHNSGSAYTDGVTTNGTPGSAGAYTQIVVDATTVQSLFYYCSSHSGMGGAFNVGSSETVQYQQRAGFAIQNRTTDPVPFAQAKIDNPYVGSWAAGGSLNSAREWLFGSGTQTAGWVTGGRTTPGDNTGNTGATETYNGSSWSETGDMSTGRNQGVAYGTNTAGVASGGYTTTLVTTTEEFGGSSWTSGGALNTARRLFAGAGTQTAGVVYGGAAGPGATADTETYDGSSYTEVNNLNTARESVGGSGTNTAAFAAGGGPPNVFEEWNGSTWTEKTEMNTDRDNVGASGTTTDAVVWGGDIPPGTVQTLTEAWNGTSWTEVNDLATARRGFGTSNFGSTGKLAFSAGGTPPGVVATTEEWSFGGIAPDAPAVGYSESIVGDIYYNSGTGEFKAIKEGVGSWSSGTNLGSASAGRGGAGPKTAAIAFGGTGSPPTSAQTITELYDGSSWTEVADMNTGRFMMCPAQQGSQTAALAATGTTGPSDGVLNELWNGSSWTEVNDLNSTHAYAAGIGTSTAALAVGAGPSPRAINESWDGTNWTEVGDLNSGRYFEQASGTQAAGLVFGGDPGGPFTANTEAWDGSSWTEVADLNTARSTGGGFGSQTSAIMASGYTPSYVANTEFYDGTSWSEVNDVATARTRMGSNGPTGSSGMIVGGMEPSMSALVEEWEIPDFETKTVTTS